MKTCKNGRVFLIGLGPGDPDLITLKAVKTMRKCDVLVYDRLVNPELLEYNQGAERIYVGKASGNHTLNQDEINELLHRKASAGHVVGRLKGGDPFVFGRGGEEAEYLKLRGIECSVIPGITSATAVPLYAGIPVTHRRIATSFHVITGHESGKDLGLNWSALGKLNGTLVFLMGLGNLPLIAEKLIENGKHEDCPAAVIMNGTCPDQREVYGTLKDINEKCIKAGMKSPSIIVIGNTIALRDQISTSGCLPLSGMKVVSTRPADKGEALGELLENMGATVINLPCIKIEGRTTVRLDVPPVESIQAFVFSSTYGVHWFIDALKKSRVDIRSLRGKLFGVGPSVKRELESHALQDCLIPESYNAKALAALIRENLDTGARLLNICGSIGGEVLEKELQSYEVERLEVYDTVIGCSGKAPAAADAIIFTSPSCVRGFLTAHDIASFASVPALCIGESTRKEAETLGFRNISVLENAVPELIGEQLIKGRRKND